MKLAKVLNIKGALLDKYQLEKYLEKIASDHVLQNESDKDTYPIPRMEENFKFITTTYELLNTHLKKGINIHPAGEWLLDNYYIIEEAVKTIPKELTLRKYKNLLGIATGPYKGFARIYVLASEIVCYTEAKIEAHTLEELLKAYQNKKTLNMEEIWNIGIFLQIAIIENIRNVCEKIYSAQMQKYRVEDIIERLVEYKTPHNQKFSDKNGYKNKISGSGQIKYPFIEYMSYRLKRYGKKAYSYLEILEEQVMKMGTTVSDVIKKEHFDIAVKKVTIGNCIKSIKEIETINFLKIFENINGVEALLKQDPIDVYENMDYKTKAYYRSKIKEISKRTKISEIYITQKVLELAQSKSNKKEKHVGYYLISDGIKELYKTLQTNKKPKPQKNNVVIYIATIVLFSTLISLALSIPIYKQLGIIASILIFISTYIPSSQIVTDIVQYLLNKFVKPTLIPKMDYSLGVPEESTTMVIIPTIVKSGQKAKDLISKLEVFYLANKSDNIYFTLAADASSSSKEVEIYDDEVIKQATEEIEKLNKKYPKSGMERFQFIYRKRMWNNKEKCFLGWERKRGLINQLNEYLLGKIENPFRANTMEKWNSIKQIPKIKYIITLDSDTNLILNSGLELIGAASHILNKPELNKTQDAVINGHALIQPRVGVDLVSARKSIFTKIFAGAGGIDPYANAISDIYQDNFGEGIFTGKGIYNLEVFSSVLADEIPENLVLSHDLLEGSYLRCALATDILLLDGYPYKYNAYMSRLSRWIRGDWQIIRWLMPNIKNKSGEKKRNPLNILSKFKILDNIRKSLVEITVLLSLFLLIILKIVFNISIWKQVSVMSLTMLLPTIIELLSFASQKEYKQVNHKYFAKSISLINASILRGILIIASLPYKAYVSIDAIIKTIYRMFISKEKLLQWTTSEEAETKAKVDMFSYYKLMALNVLAAIVGSILLMMIPQYTINVIFYAIFILWVIAPSVFCYISKEEIKKAKVKELTNKEIEYVLDIGEKTWKFFETYMNEENNYLPPDNYQEGRYNEIVDRTSSTNIGLCLLSIISAFDLGYIDIKKTITMLQNTIGTIQKLSKWNGHLYNWYNIRTLNPLMPRYISTVDSGNFVGYLYVLKQFLINLKDNEQEYKNQIEWLIETITNLIVNTDFKPLYNHEKGLFSIGFNIEENMLTNSYYDLLASEARQASLVAIAKNDVSSKHWQKLSRTLTIMNGYKGLVSWSGTAFEYLMPNINIPKYEGSLLDESCKFMIMSQIEYAKKLGIPWGISESAFNIKDLNSNYQYKAFGIPWLGLKRGLEDEMVVSAYGSILAINDIPKDVVKNLKNLQGQGMYNKFGFYEAIDYTPSRLAGKKKHEVVKTYMAHHQALILLSINNLINNSILQERFIENPEIKAIDVLLQERMPEDVIITKEKKEKIEKIKNIDYQNYTMRVYTKLNNNLNNYNLISSDDYSVCINERGEGFSKYKDILINRYKETNEQGQGINFYIKNIRTKRIWNTIYSNEIAKPDKYEVNFTQDYDKFIRNDEDITTTLKIITAPEDPVEIRSVELKNNGNIEETLEISSIFEPVLSVKEQDYSHMAFNNLFLKYEYNEETNSIIVTRDKRGNTKPIYLGVNLYTSNETIGELEYEIDKERLCDGNVFGIPNMVKNSIPFTKSLGLTVSPIVALKRTIKIKPGEKVKLNLVIAISEQKEKVEQNITKYKNSENAKRAFELSRVRAEEEAKYLGLKGKDIENYQKILSYLVVQNPMKKLYIKDDKKYFQKDLWKFGISGDLPILLVKIKDVNEAYVIKELLKAYEFFKVNNFNIDLVILNGEENVYERYVKDAIEIEIQNMQLMYMLNQKGGIYIINENEIETIDKELLEFRANLMIDSHSGNIKNVIKELEEEYIETIKKERNEPVSDLEIPKYEKRTNLIDLEKLKYYNEYGAFSEDGKEYIIKMTKDTKPKVVWSHVLANPEFGTVITNNNSGYTWCRNSRLSRITAWNNDPLCDTPSEIIYIKDKEYGKVWSLSPNINKDDEEYYMTYGFGYAKFSNIRMGLLQEQTTFVPIEDNVKVSILRLKNTLAQKKDLKLIYYLKPVLGEDELKTNGYINIEYNKDSNIVYAKNLYVQDIEKQECYVSTSEKIKSYTGNRKKFIGNGSLTYPEGIQKVKLNNENSLGDKPCIAIQIDVELKAFEDKEIVFVLGESGENSRQTAYKYTEVKNACEELEKTKKYWADMLRRLQVKTPLESMNIILNGWLAYQTIASRIWARSGFYQSGGAFGFRDQLQDTLGMKYINSDLMKQQILKHASHQFLQGDVEHWWHEETKRGIRTKFSDDLLWLAYVTCEYINYTGDLSILEEEIAYLQGDLLTEEQDEIYDEHPQGEYKENLYMHCIRAIEKAVNLGEHGIPKIGTGDWNDGFSTVGNKGKGESIWLGFFLYEVLNRFIPICEQKEDYTRVEKFKAIQEKLKKALNTDGWDGRWYRRAFTDQGDILGSAENEECRIDSIAQSWSVISKAGDNDKKYISMESLENHLVDKSSGIIKLLDPAFEKSKFEPGYIKAYLPGVRENGGQYTHAAIWAIIAWGILGMGDKATEYFRMINPIEHTRTKDAVNRYKVEPYVIAADVYGVGNLSGRGGWTWYTGSSSWMYKAGIEYILGLQITNQMLTINPAIPQAWKEYSIRYEFKTSIYNIKVKNPNGKTNGIEKFIVNGEEIEDKKIKLIDNGKINEIEVIM